MERRRRQTGQFPGRAREKRRARPGPGVTGESQMSRQSEHGTAVATRDLAGDALTQEVVDRFAAAESARLREVMQSLVRHLHAFARDVKLTEAEWFAAIQ